MIDPFGRRIEYLDPILLFSVQLWRSSQSE